MRQQDNCPPSAPAEGLNAVDNWFAIRTDANCERRIATALEGKGFESYLPMMWTFRTWGKRTRKVQRPLFAGYVFARFDPLRRLPVLTTPGVAYIVGTGTGPSPVDPEELAGIRRIFESETAAEPYPYLVEGTWVALEDGPLRGLRGRLVSTGNELGLIVSVTLLQRSVAVRVERRWVRPTSEDGWDCREGAVSY